MSPAEEQKLLRATLSYLEKPNSNWSWPLFLTESAVWLALALTAIWLYERPGGTSLEQWLLVSGALVGGGILGIVSLSRNSHQRWALLRGYVDKDRIQSRLNELGA